MLPSSLTSTATAACPAAFLASLLREALMGGKDRAPIFTWHVNLRDRDTHDLHDSEGSVCECEQPYSDYRDGQISPAMAAQREPYLPVLLPMEKRERVCVCTSVRGGALLDPCDIVFPPHEPPHMVGGQEWNIHKNGLGPVAVLCRLSRTERNSTSDHSTLCSSQSSLFQSFSHLSWQRPSFQQLI